METMSWYTIPVGDAPPFYQFYEVQLRGQYHTER